MNELDILNERLRDIMNARADDMIDGGCKDFPAYRHAVGVLHGLAIAERELLDLQKQVEES